MVRSESPYAITSSGVAPCHAPLWPGLNILTVYLLERSNGGQADHHS